MKRPGFAVFPAPRVSPPAGMCSFSRHGEGDRDSYCCRTKLHARWMGLQAPAIVKGLNKSRPVETQRRELPSPRAFQAPGGDAHKHSWPPSRRGTRCSNPAPLTPTPSPAPPSSPSSSGGLFAYRRKSCNSKRGRRRARGGCNRIRRQKSEREREKKNVSEITVENIFRVSELRRGDKKVRKKDKR